MTMRIIKESTPIRLPKQNPMVIPPEAQRDIDYDAELSHVEKEMKSILKLFEKHENYIRYRDQLNYWTKRVNELWLNTQDSMRHLYHKALFKGEISISTSFDDWDSDEKRMHVAKQQHYLAIDEIVTTLYKKVFRLAEDQERHSAAVLELLFFYDTTQEKFIVRGSLKLFASVAYSVFLQYSNRFTQNAFAKIIERHFIFQNELHEVVEPRLTSYFSVVKNQPANISPYKGLYLTIVSVIFDAIIADKTQDLTTLPDKKYRNTHSAESA